MKLITYLISILPVLALGVVAQGADEPASGINLSVYNDSFALVRERRELEEGLKKGLNVIRFRDVASTIEATSVHFKSLTDPAATVVEQNYEFDLVDGNKLLTKYIDKPLTAFTTDGKSYHGTLMSFDNRQLVLAEDKDKGPIFMVERGDNIKRIQFSSLPEGLLTRPTLVWEIEATKEGKHTVEVSYIAREVRWRADYNLVVNADESKLDLSGWVTLENRSGTGYRNAAVKLLAGAGRRSGPRDLGAGPEYYKMLTSLPPTSQAGDDPSRVFGEYRLYELKEPTSVNNNQIKQIEMIRAEAVPITKTYVYDGSKTRCGWNNVNWDRGFGGEENKKVNVLVQMENRADRHLGIALPKGKCRVFKKDSDGAMEFIGEDNIEHTARDERAVLYIGDAFDVVGERKQTDFKKLANKVWEESFEVKVRNHKKESVAVKILEKLYRSKNWEIVQKSQDFEKADARTVIFPVEIKPDGEAAVTYRVRYRE